jgi:amino acid permease
MYNKKQRIAALIGIILLVLLYLATLISAIFNFDGSGRLFQSCLFATIAVPILLWIYIWFFGKFTGKKTIADIDAGIDAFADADGTESAQADDNAKNS